MATKYKYTRIRQVGGDDGYCWAVFVNGREKLNGLTRTEADAYRKQFEREEEAEKIRLSTDEAMVNRAAAALSQTRQAIGYDCLRATAEDLGRSLSRVSMSRDDVIDCVTSCGYVGGYPEMYGNDKEAVKWLNEQTEQVKDYVCKQAFQHSRYGI